MQNALIDTHCYIEPEFDVKFMEFGSYTFASVTNDGKIMAFGQARRKPGDPPCEAVGRTLALSRALAELSERYALLHAALDVANSLEVEGV